MSNFRRGMKSFINSSSSESDSETDNISKNNKKCYNISNKRKNYSNSTLEERKTPLKQSVYEYMAQAKVVLHGAADLEDHIQSTLLDSPHDSTLPLRKKRKTFYDSSDDDEEEITSHTKKPGSPDDQKHSLVIGDLVSKISPPKSSSNSNSAENTPSQLFDETDVWMEEEVNPEHSGEKKLKQRKRKYGGNHDDFSSDDELEDVRPQLKTAGPVREAAPILLIGAEEKKPSVKKLTSSSESTLESSNPHLPQAWVNKYAAQYLKDYQIEGVEWLYQKFTSKAGCILG